MIDGFRLLSKDEGIALSGQYPFEKTAYCLARGGGWYCSRPKDHKGSFHISYGDGKLTAEEKVKHSYVPRRIWFGHE